MIIPNRKPDGQWETFQSWVIYATRDIGGMNSVCYDRIGRRCKNGGHFMLADKESTFPVSFWHGEGGKSKREQEKDRKRSARIIKLNNPWRANNV